MKTIKELEDEEMIGNKLGYLNALKDIIKLINKSLNEDKILNPKLEELKARINGDVEWGHQPMT